MRNIQTILIALLTCLLVCLSHNQLKADNILGGNITYTCISTNEYVIEVQIYEDCAVSISMGSTINVSLSSQSCGTTMPTQVLPLVQGPEIVTPTCSGEPDACSSAGVFGINRYLYRDTITMTQSCTDWVASWENCCRNPSITTLATPSVENTYISATINNTLGDCNSSPTFLNNPTFYTCIGEAAYYSLGVTESDGDSLVFSLADCKNSATGTVNYNAGFSGTSPVTTASGVSIDSKTGGITFTPINAEVGVICILVEEYRNGAKIGEVSRDIQIVTKSCTNAQPILSGMNGTANFGAVTGSFDTTVCAGTPINFVVASNDINSIDQVSMTWNQGISNASFTVQTGAIHPTGTFDWIPEIDAVGFHIFTVTVKDDACPLVGENTYTFSIEVLPSPDVFFPSTFISTCSLGEPVLLTAVSESLDSAYSWTPATTLDDSTLREPTATPTSFTTYTLTKTFTNGCTGSNSMSVEPTTGVTISPLTDQTICLGDSAFLQVTTSSISTLGYNWTPTTDISDPFSSTTYVFPTTATSYTVIATDFATTCKDTQTVKIDVESSLAAPTVTCCGTSTTSVTFCWNTIANATGYEVNVNDTGWGTPNSTLSHTVTGLNPNASVSVKVRGISGAGCSVDSTQHVCSATTCNLSTFIDSISNISCFGVIDGYVNIGVSIGIAPYKFTMGTITQTTGEFSGLAAGNYTVTITGGDGCVTTQTFQITEPTIVAASPEVSDVTCNGTADGAINLKISGGTSPYSFVWNTTPVKTTEIIEDLTAGNYDVTVTDANGCLYFNSLLVTEPSPYVINKSFNDPSCFGGSDGQINLQATGGTTPYKYVWNTGQLTDTIANLTAGNYRITITDDQGCVYLDSFDLVAPLPYVVTDTVTNPSCFDTNNGEIEVVILSGGTFPYTYAWNTGQTNDTITNIGAGNYIVTITDDKGCIYTDTFPVVAPLPYTVNTSFSNPLCEGSSDGQINLQVFSGGTSPYTYAWNTGQTTDTITNLTAGNYIVTVTDLNGCLRLDTFDLVAPSSFVATDTMINPTCAGGNDGQIDIQSIVGGTAPFSYAWNTGQTTESIANLTIGTYLLTITDANNCTDTSIFNLVAPIQYQLTSAITNPVCQGSANGTISIAADSNATAPFTYNWNTGQTDSSLSNLTAGDYIVTVTDAKGCIKIDTFALNDPVQYQLIPTLVEPTCPDSATGQISIAINSNGVAPFSYNWSTGAIDSNVVNLTAGTYTVTVTDANSCEVINSFTLTDPPVYNVTNAVTTPSCSGGTNGTIDIQLNAGGTPPLTYAWSTGQTVDDISNLTAGTYILTITDVNDCPFVDTIEVTEPLPYTVTINRTSPTCSNSTDGQINTQVSSGGTAPFSYIWNTGQTSANLTNLTAGIYSLTVSDANGCTNIDTVELTNPSTYSITPNISEPPCPGSTDGQITIQVNPGGNPPFAFDWSTGATTATVSGLSAGTYTVTVTDLSGCAVSQSMTLTDLEAPQSSVIILDSILCYGESTGRVGIFIEGQTNIQFEDADLAAGTYNFFYVNPNGCLDTITYSISQPSALTIATVSCNSITNTSDPNGAASILANGGTPFSDGSYFYQWNDPLQQTTPTAENLDAGVYRVTVTDANGCEANAQVRIDGQTSKSITITPNGDGKNDFFSVCEFIPTLRNELIVSDRWGNVLFRKLGYKGDWNGIVNGEQLPEGTYYYVFFRTDEQIYRGSVIVLRDQ